jgi:hypothetical protein
MNWTHRMYQLLLAVTIFFVVASPVQALTWSWADSEADFQGVCKFAGTGQSECTSCVSQQGIWTALGCIPATEGGLFETIFTVGLGMAGGIAFLLILFGGFQILSSAGNPEQLNEGRELVSSAVAGLLLIIFSVFLLRLVGYDILRIPGFGR